MDKCYSLDEIALMPAVTTSVRHRGDINPFYGDRLPIFVSPMTCLLNPKNWETFNKSKVTPIYPIIYNDYTRMAGNFDGWRAVTLEEFKYFFNACHAEELVKDGYYKILIDCANGHMDEVLDCVYDAKQEYGKKLIVMYGNISNPQTYLEYCKAGVDYARVGIGGNLCCETGSKTGIHISLPFLLDGIQRIRKHIETNDSISVYHNINYECPLCDGEEVTQLISVTKVIADGGVNTIDKAIKCLALGADYVMMGTLFAECEEACGESRPCLDDEGNVISYERHYYGQASFLGQRERLGKESNYSEGSDRWVPILYSLEDFCNEFTNVLRSTMSYCNAFTLDEFIGKVQYCIQTLNEYKSFNR